MVTSIVEFIKITISREEAISTIAGFHACPLSWSNWNLEILVFAQGGKRENPEENQTGGVRREPTTNSTHINDTEPGSNQPRHTSALTAAALLLPKYGNNAPHWLHTYLVWPFTGRLLVKKKDFFFILLLINTVVNITRGQFHCRKLSLTD